MAAGLRPGGTSLGPGVCSHDPEIFSSRLLLWLCSQPRGVWREMFGRGWAGVSLVFCAVPGTQWVLNKCLLLIIKPILFTLGLSPKSTLHT